MLTDYLIDKVVSGSLPSDLLESIDRAQAEMLADRLNKAAEKKPQWRELQKVLSDLSRGSMLVVPKNGVEPHLPALLSRGFLKAGSGAKMIKGEANQCHKNTSNLYLAGKVDTIVTGYALSSDGLWRQHSWGLSDGKVIETTERRVKYFGVSLNDREIRTFIRANY